MPSSNSSSPPPPSTVWKDLPRRFLTIGIGVPWIALQMRYRLTSWLFFQVSHLICLLEWRTLVPSSGDGEDYKEKNGAATTASSTSSRAATAYNGSNKAKTIQQKLMTILSDDQWNNSASKLEKWEFYIFSFFSITMTIIPTSFLPLLIMFASISLRLIPYILPATASHPKRISMQSTIQHYQFGLIYLSTGFHYLLSIRQQKEGGARHIGCLLFVVWMSDTGALILGRWMNNKKNQYKNYNISNTNGKKNVDCQIEEGGIFLSFLKAISPGKTISGIIGGIITGPISSLFYPMDIPPNAILNNIPFNNHIVQKIFLGIILSTAGIIGDLAESSVKRMSGKKDSGGLLPGHGGVVDRFDSLFTAGIVYYYLILF